MPSAYYVHPEFGYLAPTSRWRRDLKVAAISIFFGAIAGAGGLTVLIADHNGETDIPSTSKTDVPSTSTRVEASTAEPRSDPGPGAQPTRQASRPSLPTTETTPGTVSGAKPTPPETDGKSNAAKPGAGAASGSLRAANEAPAIGRTPVGRSAASPVPAVSGSDDPPGSASPPDGAQARSTDAAVPAEPPAPSAAPAKKPQKTARSNSRRRDQHRIDAPSWRELREDEWTARRYTDYPSERYGRGADRHEGRYVRDGFWSW